MPRSNLIIRHYQSYIKETLEENERTILKVKVISYLRQKDVRERLGTGPSQPVTGVLINDHYNHNHSNNTIFENVRDLLIPS